jgi:hypothetical protein
LVFTRVRARHRLGPVIRTQIPVLANRRDNRTVDSRQSNPTFRVENSLFVGPGRPDSRTERVADGAEARDR